MPKISIKATLPPKDKVEVTQAPIAKDFAVSHLIFNSGAVPGVYLTGIWQNGKRILPSILGISVLTLTNRIREMVLKKGTELKLEFSNKGKESVELDLEIHGNLK